MGRVLAIDPPPSLARHLRDQREVELVIAPLDELLPALEGRRPAAVVLGPGVENPARVVAELYRLDRRLPVVVLLDDDRFGAVESGMRFSPFVSRDTRCLSTASPSAELARAIADIADASERRRLHAETLERVRGLALPGALMTNGPRSSRYLGQLLYHAPIGVITVDPTGTIGGWNPKATEILGRLAQDAVGTSLTSLFPAGRSKALLDALTEAFARDDAVTCILARGGRDGTEQHVELTVAAIDLAVPSLGCLVLLQDVTERIVNQRELAERARSATLAAEVGMVFTSAESLRQKLQRCAEAIVRHLDAAFARVWLAEPAGAELVLWASAGIYTHLDGPHGRIPVGAYKIGRIAATRRPHLTNQVVGDPEISDPEWAAREGMVAFAGYPLLLGDDLVGVMALFACDPLSQWALQALGAIADTVAVGVEQARARERLTATLEREHAARAEAELAAQRYQVLAKTLQQSLLPPRLPEVPGIELSARYHWAGDGTTVGGDFYDAFLLADGGCCAVMGDVSGKGVKAAKLTSLARYTLRTSALTSSTPAKLLDTLNAALCQQVTGDEFCTVAVVVLASSPGGTTTMTAASAGHPLPVIVRSDGTLQEIGEPGPPAGLFELAAFPEVRTELDDGDVVVLVTDGVLEARSPDGRFHSALLHDTLARCQRWPAVDVAAAVESAVLAFENALPRDDLAILAIRVGAASESHPETRAEPGGEPLDDDVLVYRLPAQPAWVPAARSSMATWLAARPQLRPQSDAALLVATELVTNAVRAARSRVELRAWEVDAGLTLEVRDDGYGLPPAALERAPSSADDEYGRGLSIVRSLTEWWEVDRREQVNVVRCLVPVGRPDRRR